jgi:hypothetical protein
MKTDFKVVLICLFMILKFDGFAQDANTLPAGTTEEEYNYLSKGYKVQIEAGLDMKKGYLFQDFGEVKHSSYSFDFKLLIREAKKEVAGILVITKSEVWGHTYYVAIPVNNTELMAKYYSTINGWDEALTTSYCYVVSSYMANLTSAAMELEKRVKGK